LANPTKRCRSAVLERHNPQSSAAPREYGLSESGGHGPVSGHRIRSGDFLRKKNEGRERTRQTILA
jgi:hypothetical protein